jgi:membrane protein DedA with SNARE-associated domain
MKIWLFLLAVFTGRVARYGIEAALTILYGPKIIEAMADLFQHHLMATLVALGILLAGLVAWGWRRRHRRHLPPGA